MSLDRATRDMFVHGMWEQLAIQAGLVVAREPCINYIIMQGPTDPIVEVDGIAFHDVPLYTPPVDFTALGRIGNLNIATEPPYFFMDDILRAYQVPPEILGLQNASGTFTTIAADDADDDVDWYDDGDDDWAYDGPDAARWMGKEYE